MDLIYQQMKTAATAGELIAEAAHEQLQQRGRGFASDKEQWAEVKEICEVCGAMQKSAEKLHKEMWDALTSKSDDAYTMNAQELKRLAEKQIAAWAQMAATITIGLSN